ncbi:hypothetical protein SEA_IDENTITYCRISIS_30 [Mycobacterium phage IdentityCrisis]|uniref:DUF732 domain-containing protein n=1 Tax=Mycobacterium phage IdentityCrisis TaxID=2599866 RepID=A0A5J6TH27_9CAUD|nr:hypothetical protein QEH37_gp30 [Mycobacterium phage IdentityCrisis]QFG10050.1 hypothetical protein SEA_IDENTITYCRISIS_30 [Mycobacterium phage IdentityCrisis]
MPLLLVTAAVTVAPVTAPIAHAEPDVFGLITDDEAAEIWANGQRNCVILDQAGGTADSVGALIDRYQSEGWDLESSVDIVWESVEGRCPEYVDTVKRVARTYGDPS